MWFILGMIILAILCMTIQVIVSETVENKRKVFLIGYCLGSIIALIFVARFIRPKLHEYENKVNELRKAGVTDKITKFFEDSSNFNYQDFIIAINVLY